MSQLTCKVFLGTFSSPTRNTIMDIKEIHDIIQDLNEVLPESLYAEALYFDCSSNGYAQTIMFCGIILWCSDNDEREYIGDELEPLLSFVKRKFNSVLDSMNQIRFKD